MKRRLVITIAGALLFYLGFVAGTIQSTFTLEYLDAPAKGVIAIRDLHLLRKNQHEILAGLKEVEIDGAIYNHVRYREGIYPILAWPISSLRDYSYQAKMILEYRRRSPVQDHTMKFEEGSDGERFWLEHNKEMQRRLDRMREWYGQ